MHAAHRSVGVSGVAAPFRAGCPLEFPLAGEPRDVPVRVCLVPCATDRRIVASMTAFERILVGNGAWHCNRVDFATVEIEGLADADCAVVFGRGLQIVGRWSAIDADVIGLDGFQEEGFDMEVEIAAAARRHPVVDGVGTFIARHGFSHSSHFYPDSTCLLVGKWEDEAFPVAWAQQCDGRAFYTLLGHPQDFRCRGFVRLLLNAMEWATLGT